MYVINEDKRLEWSKVLKLYRHPDTDVREYIDKDEDWRRRICGNLNRKEILYFRIKFLEGRLREIDEDIWFSNSLENRCMRALYTRNLEGLKQFRKHLYNCEGACYESADEIIGRHLEFNI